MRDILFRGKSTGDLGTWIYGYYYYDNATEQHCILDKDTLYKYDVIPETVGQWTGLLDATKWEELTEEERSEWTRKGNFPSEWKGRPIYEGDILRYSYKRDTQTKETFTEVVEYSEMPENSSIGFNAHLRMEYKVIDTIHDNPEMINNEQQDN